MGRWPVRAALWLTMFWWAGTNETIGPRPFRVDSITDRSSVDRSGDVTINCLWGGRETTTQQHSSEFGGQLEAIGGWTSLRSSSRTNERWNTKQKKINQTTISPKRCGVFAIYLLAVLCFFS
jgi:hypothetical protein